MIKVVGFQNIFDLSVFMVTLVTECCQQCNFYNKYEYYWVTTARKNNWKQLCTCTVVLIKCARHIGSFIPVDDTCLHISVLYYFLNIIMNNYLMITYIISN